MSAFEYRAVPAPRRGKPGKGMRGAPAKFANAVSELMNDMATQGWQYLRADTLPCEERQGLTGKTVKYHSMLVFRRPLEEAGSDTEEAAETLALPVPEDDEAFADDDAQDAEFTEDSDEELEDVTDEDAPEAANDDPEKRDNVAAE